MASQKKIITTALAIATIMMVAGVLALTSQRSIPTTGTIKGINLGVYSDVQCLIPLVSINWGTAIENGTNVPVTVYLKNSGTTDMTLSMQLNTWVPTDANTHLSIDWDKEGVTLLANATGFAATLTLHVPAGFAPDADYPFSVNVVIIGTH